MKKKREKTNVALCAKFILPEEFQSSNPLIQLYIDRLREADSFDVQQDCFNCLTEHFKQPDEDEGKQFVVKLISFIFVTINSKLPIRKTLMRILSTTSEELVVVSIAEYLKIFIKNVKDDENVLSRRNEVLSYVMSCVENFTPGLKAVTSAAIEIFTFSLHAFERLFYKLQNEEGDAAQTRQDIFTYMHTASRVILLLLQKCDNFEKLSEVSLNLTKLCFDIIIHELVPFETKSNSGIILAYACNKVPEEFKGNFEFKKYASLELLRCSFDEYYSIDQLGVTNIYNNISAKVAIFCGILNAVPKAHLSSVVINNLPTSIYMLLELGDCARMCTNEPPEIIEVARALTVISRRLDKVQFDILKVAVDQGLSFVWHHLDHYIDTVRNCTKTFFTNIVKLAVSYKIKDNGYLLQKILKDIDELPKSTDTRYVALMLVANEVSCNYLLLNMRILPYELLFSLKEDPTLAQPVLSLYEFLMEKHFKELAPTYEEIWVLQWVKIILPRLNHCNEIARYYQRLLVSAFKINPFILRVFIAFQFGGTPNELGTLLDCLRVARKTGIQVSLIEIGLDEHTQQSRYWRGLIEYKTLEVNMFHQHDEIRLSVLALVVESQKSTEIFMQWELNFLRKFLYYNIAAQVPGTRKQIISLYKKVFMRIKEGLGVINRVIKNFEKKRERLNKKAEERKKQREEQGECSHSIDETVTYSDEEFEIKEGSDTIEVNTKDGDPDNVEFEFMINPEVKGALNIKNSYNHFLSHFLRECLLPGLVTDANYPRRSACLELLLFFDQMFPDQEFRDMWYEDDINNLIYNIVFDSYESNKEMTVNLLRKFPVEQLNFTKEHTVQDMKNCITLASSIKPTNTLSAAYTFEFYLCSPFIKETLKQLLKSERATGDPLIDMVMLLCIELRRQLKECKEKAFGASKSVSMYGVLFSIRHLFLKAEFKERCTTWPRILDQLVNLCLEIYEHVKPIVNSASPEGNLPEEDDIVATDESNEAARAQLHLVFAWRNVKEISLFLGEIAAKAVQYEKEFSLVPESVLLVMGNIFIKLFLQTRHRGVFEQAYFGFVKLCQGFWNSTSQKLSLMPDVWLMKMLNLVTTGIRESREQLLLCPTRRSAGLPFLILAILTTEPQTRANKSFNICIKMLLKLALDQSETSKGRCCHSMNILRALYRNNQLGELVMPYVARGVAIAITGFKSKDWGVRNSATLLYAALITRIFGVQRTRDLEDLSIKNRMTAKVFFLRFPYLHTFFLKELSTGVEDGNSIALYLVLLILARLYPMSIGDNTEVKLQLEEFLPYINKCLSNPAYRIRDLAAQASVPLISSQDAVKYVARILILLSNMQLLNNECQGLLFQLTYLLKSLSPNHKHLDIPKLLVRTFWILLCAGRQISLNTASLYLEVIVQLISNFREDCNDSEIFTILSEIIDYLNKRMVPNLSHAARTFVINLFYLKMYIMGTVMRFKNLIIINAVDEIVTNLNSGNDFVRKFALNLVNYLNFDRHKYRHHGLYIASGIEISEKEFKIVQDSDPLYKNSLVTNLHLYMKTTITSDMVQYFSNTECVVPAFLLLAHYPCISCEFPPVFEEIQPLKEHVLNYLLSFCNCDIEEVISAVISCISIFLRKTDMDNLKLLPFTELILVLGMSAAPTASIHRRLAVCDFMLCNRTLILSRDTCFSVREMCDMWSIVLVLLEDEDQVVRDLISKLNTRTAKTTKITAKIGLDIIAERAREELLMMAMHVLPWKDAVKFLILWSIRHKPDFGYEDSSEVFDKGYVNLYSETTPVVKVTVKLLKELLWPLEEGLSYEDMSIFIEEKALMVTMHMVSCVSLPTKMVSKFTYISLMNTLKRIILFLEDVEVGKPSFKAEFKKYLIKEQMSCPFGKTLNKNDFNSLRILYWTLYAPIL